MKWFLKCFDGIKFMFSGRARRKEYWMFQLFNFLIALLFSFLFFMFLFPAVVASSASGDIKELMGGIALGGVIFLFILFVPFTIYYGYIFPITSVAVSVRRLHDVGFSGWWWLLNLTIIGIPFIFILSLLDSKPGKNKWGDNPKGN